MTTPAPLMTRLAQHRALGAAPAREHQWLVDHGTLRTLAAGDILARKGEQATSLLVLFTGRIVIRIDRGAGSHALIEQKGGDVTGELPFSRGTRAPNDVVADEPSEMLAIARELLPELIRECPVITATMVHAMIDRARHITSSDLRDEKLLSLGKLAAGLAHELNNPASAAVRSARVLAGRVAAAESAAETLGAARLTKAQIAAVDVVRQHCNASTDAAAPTLSAVARADREDAITVWLAQRGIDDACAGTLAGTSLPLSALDELAAVMGGETLDAALQSVAAGCVVRTLTSELETSASRIYDLVDAVKRFTYMDHAPTPEPVDIRRGISDTLTMLGAKTRANGVEVSVRFAPDLPRAYAVGAEMNQVWMNLIDNALDAVGQGGHIDVAATGELDHVVVRVTDDGPGIPPEIRGRIFDPFFTTKGVGEGTGLGLDIVRRLLKRHDGAIDVESRPGHTEFRVSLPAAP